MSVQVGPSPQQLYRWLLRAWRALVVMVAGWIFTPPPRPEIFYHPLACPGKGQVPCAIPTVCARNGVCAWERRAAMMERKARQRDSAPAPRSLLPRTSAGCSGTVVTLPGGGKLIALTGNDGITRWTDIRNVHQ
jgi:hypothetical protein